jgi:hypothetical protein
MPLSVTVDKLSPTLAAIKPMTIKTMLVIRV